MEIKGIYSISTSDGTGKERGYNEKYMDQPASKAIGALYTVVRTAGIVIATLAIPFSLLTLLALQGIGSEPVWEITLNIAAAVVNAVAVPLFLAGFITRQRSAWILPVAAVHFILFLAITALIYTETVRGSESIPLMLALPSAIYLLGRLLRKE